MAIPWELKYKYALGGWTSIFKGFMYEIREKYGEAEAIEMYERLCKRDDRVKNMTNALKDVFNIEGQDAETIAKWHDIWHELCGYEYNWLERSKSIARIKITKWPFKLAPKDINDHSLRYENIVTKTINLKATVERPKAMCAGNPYCEYVWKIED